MIKGTTNHPEINDVTDANRYFKRAFANSVVVRCIFLWLIKSDKIGNTDLADVSRSRN